MTLKLKKEGKDEEFKKAIQEMQQGWATIAKHSGFTKRFQESNKKPQYFFGDFTYLDAALIPSFQIFTLYYSKTFGIDLLQADNQEIAEDLEAIRAWFELTRQRPSFRNFTYQLKRIPSQEEFSFFKQINMNKDNYDFESLTIQYITALFNKA